MHKLEEGMQCIIPIKVDLLMEKLCQHEDIFYFLDNVN